MQMFGGEPLQDQPADAFLFTELQRRLHSSRLQGSKACKWVLWALRPQGIAWTSPWQRGGGRQQQVTTQMFGGELLQDQPADAFCCVGSGTKALA